MDAAAGAQHFATVFLEAHVGGNGGDFLAHNVGGSQALQRFADGDLSHAGLCGVENEPANKGQPYGSPIVFVDSSVDAPTDHGIGNHFAAGSGGAGGTGEILGHAPNNGAKHAAAIERETGQEIEGSQQEIGEAKIFGQRANHFVSREGEHEQEEHAREKAAGQRSGDGDVEFLAGFGWFAGDAGQSTEDEQGDGKDLNFVTLGDETVSQSVEKYGAKKENAGGHAGTPLLRGRPFGMLFAKL